jgi:hypothetical protein
LLAASRPAYSSRGHDPILIQKLKDLRFQTVVHKRSRPQKPDHSLSEIFRAEAAAQWSEAVVAA